MKHPESYQGQQVVVLGLAKSGVAGRQGAG